MTKPILELKDVKTTVKTADGEIVPILKGINLEIRPGDFITIIGTNGAGKSTLFNTIAGSLKPDSGILRHNGQDITKMSEEKRTQFIGRVFQDPKMGTAPRMTVAENLLLATKRGKRRFLKIRRLKQNLPRFKKLAAVMNNGLESRLNTFVEGLSGGQRQALSFLMATIEKPDILLLDEPTNHLDEAHITWLTRYLQEYENAFILISHDIPFLNSVINLIYHMANQELNRYVGDYDNFVRIYEAKKAQLESAYKKQQQEIADLKDFVARNKARVSTRNMAMSRQKKLDKMEIIELAAERPKPEFNFKVARTAGRYIFETKDLVIGYDEPLSAPLNLTMERGQKIAICGANGIGKTTLLRSILGEIPAISGSVELGEHLHIGYFEQEIKGGKDKTCLQEFWDEFPHLTQGEARAALAKCGLTTKHIESKVMVLSGGEQAKVRLAKLINRETNVLILDEPTNHLDVDAKEELKRALKEYKGSVLLISHEPEFYREVVTDIWDGEKWTTRLV